MEVRITVKGQLTPLDRVEMGQPLRKHASREAEESGTVLLHWVIFVSRGCGNV